MHPRGSVSGGATADDFLAEFAGKGFLGEFAVRPEGLLACLTCGRDQRAKDVTVHSFRRFEGASDPSDMGAVGALECPSCGARGTATFCFGPSCPPEDGAVLRALDQQLRHSRTETLRVEDGSLVSDSGWLLRGPED